MKQRLSIKQKEAIASAQLFAYVNQFEPAPKITEEEQISKLTERRPKALLISRYGHSAILNTHGE